MKIFYSLCLLLLLFSLGCEDPSDVGSGIIPENDVLPVDSLVFNDFVINNFRDDSILNSSQNSIQLGKFIDPNFGTSNASFYTEFFFSGDFTEVEGAVYDSLVLYLNTTGFQGDTLITQTINIYELDEEITSPNEDLLEPYYFYETVAKGDLITQFNDVAFSTVDSTFVDDALQRFHLKTNLPDELGMEFFQQLNDSLIYDSTTLKEYLRGFVFETDENSDGRGWFNVQINASAPNYSGLYLYYHDPVDGTEYTRAFSFSQIEDFGDNIGAQNLNPMVNTYLNADPQILTQLDNRTNTGYEQGFIQSGNGAYVEVDFTDLLDDFSITNPVINVSELRIKIDLTDNLADTTYLPTTLILAEGFITDDNGDQSGGIFTLDGSGLSNTADLSRFDSATTMFRTRESEGIYEYSIAIPKTTQSIVDGVIEPKLFILGNNRVGSFTGIKFAKANTKLTVFYTETN